MKKFLLILILFATAKFNASSQSAPVLQYAVSGGGTGNDYLNQSTADNSGNVYVIGSFSGSFSIGGTTINSTGGTDAYVAKFNSSGVLQWINRIGSGGDDAGVDITFASTISTIFICGNTKASGGTLNFFSPNSITPAITKTPAGVIASHQDFFMASIDISDGHFIDAHTSGYSGTLTSSDVFNFNANGIAAKPDGSEIYIGGSLQTNLQTDYATHPHYGFNGTYPAGFIARFNNLQTLQACIWIDGLQRPNAITDVTYSPYWNMVFVAGWTDNWVLLGCGNADLNDISGNATCCTPSAYFMSFQTGFISTNNPTHLGNIIKSGGGACFSSRISVSQTTGKVYLLTYYNGTIPVCSGLFSDVALTYSAMVQSFVPTNIGSGSPCFPKIVNCNWAKTIATSTTPNFPHDIVQGTNDTIYVIGRTQGTINFGGLFTYINQSSSSGFNDVFITKLDPSGNTSLAYAFGGSGDDYGNTICRNSAGDIFIGGSFQTTINNYPGTILNSAGGFDAYLFKLRDIKPTSVTSLSSTNICAGETVNVVFSSPTADAGNIFTAQLSNASGSFLLPIVIGTLSSTSGGTITANIPANTPAGNNYRIRVLSSVPLNNANSSAAITINEPYLYYVDQDLDGVGGNSTAYLCSATAPSGYSSDNYDCNDNDATVQMQVSYYYDYDSDGYDDGSGIHLFCTSIAPNHYIAISNGIDCDDSNSSIHPGAIEISCNGIDENCNGLADDGSLSTAPTGILSTAVNNTICLGSSCALGVTGGSLGSNAEWKWYSGSCGGLLIGSGSSISCSPTTTTTYFVRAESGCNITTCSSITITVAEPSVGITSNPPSSMAICSGTSTDLSFVGGTLGTNAEWKWYSGSCTGTPVGTGSVISVMPNGTTDYFVRAEGLCNTTDCAYIISVEVITPTPPPTAIVSSNGATLTQGMSTNLSVAGINPGTVYVYAWYMGSISQNNLIGINSTISVTPSASTIYYVVATDDCNQYTFSIPITVNTIIALSGTTNNFMIPDCSLDLGTVYVYLSGGVAPYYFLWSNGMDGTISDNIIPIIGTIPGATAYSITVTDAQSNTIVLNDYMPANNIASTWYYDEDGDGFGNPAISQYACDQPDDYVANSNDCNDQSADVNPDANEFCDGLDNDCDGLVDEGMFTINATVQNVICSNYSNGSIAISLSNLCVAPFIFNWSNGTTTQNLTGISAGNYNLTVTDHFNNQVTGSYVVGTTLPASAPAVPGTISGNQTVCVNSSYQYTIPTVQNATAYEWVVPANSSIVSGQNSNSILITFNTGFNSGLVKVRSVNCNGSSSYKTKNITRVPTLAPPDTINGSISVCPTAVEAYSISNVVANAFSYNWVLSAGSILSGQGTSNISIQLPSSFTSVTLKVQSMNECGVGGSFKSIKIFKSNSVPSSPGIISANGAINNQYYCANSTITFSINPVQGATSYEWKLNATVVAVTTLPQANINLGSASSYTISVRGVNNCSGLMSIASSKNFQKFPAPDLTNAISGPTGVCNNTLLNEFSVSPSGNADHYSWNVPDNTSIVGSNNGSSIILSIGNSFISGVITVQAYNVCNVPSSNSRQVTISTTPPAPVINGPKNNICESTTGIVYSTPLIPGSTSYSWTVSNGTIVSGQGTNSITVNFPSTFSSSVVKVKENTACSTNGAYGSLTVKQSPETPSGISGPTNLNNPTCSSVYATYSIPDVTGATSYTWTKGGVFSPGGNTTITTTSTSIVVSATQSGSGFVKVRSNGACGSSTDRTLNVTVSIAGCRTEEQAPEISLNDFQIFPNPTNGFTQVDFSSTVNEEVTLEIFNTLGQLVHSEIISATIGNNEIDLNVSDLIEGVYNVTLRSAEKSMTKKLALTR